MAATRLLLLLLACFGLAAALAACGDDDRGSTAPPATATASVQPTGATFPRTLTDSAGAAVVVRAQPRRIISLSPGVTEILFAIGAGERVVGSDKFSNCPAAAQRTAKLDYLQPSVEAALALNPDLVIMTTRQRTLVQAFRDVNLTVLYHEEPENIDGVSRSITLLGSLTRNEAGAERVVAEMRARIERVTAQVANITQGPRVFYEVTTDLYTVAPNTFIGSMLEALRARNVAEGAKSRFPQLTAEAVIAADPEVVLLSDAKYGERAESVAKRPGWAGVSAVVSRRISQPMRTS